MLVISLSVFKVILCNVIATNGIEIGHIEKQVLSLSQNNQLLKEEIAKDTSLSQISPKAIDLGFNNSGSITSLSLDIPIALR